MLFLAASQQSDLHITLAALVVGLVIGVFGHIIHSRLLIITGILIIGLVSAYFSFVLQPGAS
jgi:cytochrome c oxidase subunit IV